MSTFFPALSSLLVGVGLAAALVPAGAAAQPPPSTEALVHGYFDMWNRLDATLAERVMAPGAVGHANDARIEGLSAFQARVQGLGRAYTGVSFTLEDLVVDRDRAAVRWTFRGTNTGPFEGNPPTGRPVVVTGMNLFRVAGGRIVEVWVNADDLGELTQLGLLVR